MKKFSALIAFVLIFLSLSGCSNPINVSDLAIVQAVGIDKTKDGVQISAQYLDLAKSTGATDNMSENITSVAKGNSTSVGEAVADASLSLSSPIFFGQNKLIVISSDYAKGDIGDSLDYLLRGVDSRPDVLVAISEGKAEEIISNPERKAKIPAENLYNLLKNGEKNGVGATVTVNDILGQYADKTTDIYIPVLKSNKDYVSLVGLSVFSDNKYAATISDDDAFGFLVVNNKLETGTLAIRDDELGEIGINVSKCKCKNRIAVDNGTIYFKSNVKVKFVLNDVQKGVTSKISPSDSERLERLLSNRLKAMCISAVKTCLDKKSDPFMIGKYLARENMGLYSKVKDDWKNYLPGITYTADVESEMELISDNSVS